jgi:hypothetical protein
MTDSSIQAINIPVMAPIKDNTMASKMKYKNMSCSVAPMLLRMPISVMRS